MQTDFDFLKDEVVQPSPSFRKAPAAPRRSCKYILWRVGGVIGAFLGAAFVWNASENAVRVCAVIGAVVVGLVGVTIGAVIGAASPRRDFRPAPTSLPGPRCDAAARPARPPWRRGRNRR